MTIFKAAISFLGLWAVVTLASAIGTVPSHAAEIRATVNDEVVTTYDVSRRVAFLRLQRQGGNLNAKATDELIEEALKRSAIRRAGIRIPDSMVDQSFGRFASRNNLTRSQMTQILNQAGVTAAHFKEFIRLQIGWGQTVQLRERRQGRQMMSEQEMVAKMLERGGDKPTSTEYALNQVILVVPDSRRRELLGARRTEANNMRSRVNGCENLFELATAARDVTVRDLGRVLELELPERWAKDVKGLQAGQTTRALETERGIEFLVVCRARSVSDDRVAQLQFSTEALEEAGAEGGADFLAELRKSARIKRR
ncbi:MAG: SurA N-terminal domain-containing protein [Pseudomonadota bacterium]